jgi:hypothetical protein
MLRVVEVFSLAINLLYYVGKKLVHAVCMSDSLFARRLFGNGFVDAALANYTQPSVLGISRLASPLRLR